MNDRKRREAVIISPVVFQFFAMKAKIFKLKPQKNILTPNQNVFGSICYKVKMNAETCVICVTPNFFFFF